MYLSRLLLNPLCRQVRRDLADVRQMHRTVYTAGGMNAGTPEQRLLYRLDWVGESLVLLLQSERKPLWSKLAGDYLWPGPDALLVRMCDWQVCAGQTLRFRLRANPTFRRGRRRLAWLQETDQKSWLHRKGAQGGFSVPVVSVRAEGMVRSMTREMSLQLYSVLYDGHLQVTDPTAFHETLIRGLGSGKAFGFGLLTVAHAPAIDLPHAWG